MEKTKHSENQQDAQKRLEERRKKKNIEKVKKM